MDPSIANSIETLVTEKKQWATELLPIEVQLKHEEGTHIVNLADFIGVGIRPMTAKALGETAGTCCVCGI